MTPSHSPRIAISPCSELKLADYVESVRQAGGDPWVLDVGSMNVLDVIDRADGVVLTGGGDVHPSHYAEAAHPSFVAAEAGRDEFELTLARLAVETDTPLLAICRGLQVLNVARGGSLVQDIPDQLPSPVTHQVPEPRHAIAHDVAVREGTLLRRILRRQDSPVYSVNSRHHQAAREVGQGLIVSATAGDGIVEGLEDPSRRFCVAVQWHPENFWRTGQFRSIFDALISAARTTS